MLADLLIQIFGAETLSTVPDSVTESNTVLFKNMPKIIMLIKSLCVLYINREV